MPAEYYLIASLLVALPLHGHGRAGVARQVQMTYSRLQEQKIAAYLERQGGHATVRQLQSAVHMRLDKILPIIKSSERLALGPEPPARSRNGPSQGRRVVALRNEKLEEAS